MLQGITEEVGKQAEQRISSRFIMYAPVIHDQALTKTPGRRCGKSEASQKLNRAEDYLHSAHKHNCGTIVERYLADHADRCGTI